MHLRGALDELHVERAAGHGVHTADPTAGLEERPRLPVPPGASAPSAPPAQPPSDHGVEPVALEGDLVGLSLLPRQRSQDLNVPAAVTARGLEKSSRVARESQHRGSPCDGAAGVVVNGHGIDYGVGWERDEAGFVHGAGDSWECAGLFEDRDRARDRELCPSLHHGYLHGSAQTHHRGCDRQWSTIGSRDIRNLRLR